MKPRTLLLWVAVLLLLLLVIQVLNAPAKPAIVAPPSSTPVPAPAKQPVVTMKGSIVHLENLHANPHFPSRN